jgi:hypothetical protein
MDRIHRLGQHRPVHAIKLVIEDSIESRIVQLQEKKSAMVDATLSSDDSAMGRLTPEDLGFLFRVRHSTGTPSIVSMLKLVSSALTGCNTGMRSLVSKPLYLPPICFLFLGDVLYLTFNKHAGKEK